MARFDIESGELLLLQDGNHYEAEIRTSRSRLIGGDATRSAWIEEERAQGCMYQPPNPRRRSSRWPPRRALRSAQREAALSAWRSRPPQPRPGARAAGTRPDGPTSTSAYQRFTFCRSLRHSKRHPAPSLKRP